MLNAGPAYDAQLRWGGAILVMNLFLLAESLPAIDCTDWMTFGDIYTRTYLPRVKNKQ